MRAVYVILGILSTALAFACGWLVHWYTAPLSPPLCLSGLPVDYQAYWEAIWQTVRLGGIIGLVLMALIVILLIIIVARGK
jgi:ABC-type Fe3+ transport system permease subunit